MDEAIPIYRATTGLGGHFKVPNACKSIFQFVVMELKQGKTTEAFKVKAYCNKQEPIITKAFFD